MDSSKKNPKFHFRTNVELKSILGKDLINNDNIAVLELIKNSLDAGSPKVDVYFKQIKLNEDQKKIYDSDKLFKIVIQDYGQGMDEDDIVNKWLNIAYSEKKRITGKVLAGAKGIGRLSCDRLGEYLDIYSKKKDKPVVHLRIDWKKFEFDEKKVDTKDIEIQHIGVDVEELSGEDFEKTGHSLPQTGTIVEISKLRATWDEDKLQKLRHYLERLLNPNQTFGRAKFSIFLHAPGFGKDVNGEIRNQIFENLDFTTTVIESFISQDGTEITTNLRDKGKDVLTIIEKNSYTFLKDIKIVIYFLNTYSKIYFAKQTGIRAVDYGSIFLFKNGFRISPYGDEGNDWLGLEIRKGQGRTRYFGTRDLVGRIEINDSEGIFKEVSSREGLVENEIFNQLTNDKNGFFFENLKRLEKYVVDGLDWDRVPESVLQKVRTHDREFQDQLSKETEEYLVTQDTKNKTILNSLTSIIRTNPRSIIDLDINSKLITGLIKDEQDKANKVIKEFEKYGESKLNSKTFKVLLDVKQKVLKRGKEEAEKKAKEAEEAKNKAQEETQKAREDLQQQVSQNLFYKSRINIDVKELMLFHHDIGISAGTIDNYLTVISSKLKKGKIISSEDLEKYIKKISLEVNKINTMVNFSTKANFNDASKKIEGNIVEFIKEYIENVISDAIKTVDHKNLDIKIHNPSKIEFEIAFIPMEIMIVVDNLVKNSSKASATGIDISFEATNKNQLEIKLIDNGNGILGKNTKKIFDFAFTTTDGSGLGLYHVKEIIEKMKGGIEINNHSQKGVEIKILFSK